MTCKLLESLQYLVMYFMININNNVTLKLKDSKSICFMEKFVFHFFTFVKMMH